MRISGSTGPLPPAATQACATRRLEADAPAPAAPAPTSETSGAEAPAESGKPHGLVRAAEHSHRSEVAALRQWINHPELRDSLTVPDLAAEPNGSGFQKAVAAYEAAIATANPPATDTPPASETPPAPNSEPDLVDVLPPDLTSEAEV